MIGVLKQIIKTKKLNETFKKENQGCNKNEIDKIYKPRKLYPNCHSSHIHQIYLKNMTRPLNFGQL